MQIEWGKVLPVIVSIGVIMIVAALRNHSRAVAAIAATMPINIPLTIWIVTSGTTDNNPDALVGFIEGLLIGIIPTVFYLIAAYVAARLGWSLVMVLLAGYAAWGGTLIIILAIQAALRR